VSKTLLHVIPNFDFRAAWSSRLSWNTLIMEGSSRT